MTVDERLKLIIGDLVVNNAILTSKNEELEKKLSEKEQDKKEDE